MEEEKKKRQALNNAKAITLIALIITIIVMLVLVGVTISIVINSNLIGKAGEAGAKWKEAQKEDSNTNGIIVNGETIGNYINEIGTNSVPEISSITLDSKTTSTFTVNATATDVQGGTLTYSLYRTGSTTAVDTTTGNSGSTVQLTASGLEMYQDYTYYVTVANATASIKSEDSTVKTKCSGQTSQCTAGSIRDCSKCTTGKITCTTCNGVGGTMCGNYTDPYESPIELEGDDNVCAFCGDELTMYAYCYDDSGRTKHIVGLCYSHMYDYYDCPKLASTCSKCRGAKTITCTGCSGNKVITTYCSHTRNESHYICDHNVNGVEHE